MYSDIIHDLFSARAVPGAPHKCGICALAFQSIDVLKVMCQPFFYDRLNKLNLKLNVKKDSKPQPSQLKIFLAH